MASTFGKVLLSFRELAAGPLVLSPVSIRERRVVEQYPLRTKIVSTDQEPGKASEPAFYPESQHLITLGCHGLWLADVVFGTISRLASLPEWLNSNCQYPLPCLAEGSRLGMHASQQARQGGVVIAEEPTSSREKVLNKVWEGQKGRRRSLIKFRIHCPLILYNTLKEQQIFAS